MDGLVTMVGEMQQGQKWKRILKQQNGSLYQDWEAGGRWQVVKVGRQRSSPWPVGYGPRFLPGSREDGRRNTMRLGLSRRPGRGQRTETRPADVSPGGQGPGSFFMRHILSIYMHCSGVLILPCPKLRGADTSDAVHFLRGRAAGRGHAGTGYLATSADYTGT